MNETEFPGIDPGTDLPGALTLLEEPPNEGAQLDVEEGDQINNMIVLYGFESGHIGHLISAKLNGINYQFDTYKAYQLICQFKLELESTFLTEKILGALRGPAE